MRHTIDKVLTMQLLEAVKNALGDLNGWLMETGTDSPSAHGVSRVYAKVRRLRDYLQRSVATYNREIEIDLDEDDNNLLVSCAVHHIGVLESQMESGQASRGDLSWFREKCTNLAKWSTAHATRPVERIPVKNTLELETAGVRGLIAAIKNNTAATPDALAPAPGMPFEPNPMRDSSGLHPVAPAHLQPPLEPTPGFGFGNESSPAVSHSDPIPAPATPSHSGSREPAGLHPVVAESAGGGLSSVGGVFLDVGQIVDPRLRSLATMDLSAFERTQANGEHRLAMVHLASVFEAIVVDYALPRLVELGIKGPPETWRIEEIVRRALAERITATDRAQVLQMVAARHLVRPAVQLHAPVVVTAATLGRAIALTNRCLVEFGYTGFGGDPWLRTVD